MDLPVFFIGGHSGINSTTASSPIDLLPDQYIITPARCGRLNYAENKKIFSYMKNANGINRLRKGLIEDPDAFVQNLTRQKYKNELSTYQVHYHGGAPIYDQKIDIVRENYNGFRRAPNNNAFSKFGMTPFPNRRAVAANRIEEAINKNRANMYRNNPSFFENIWLGDLIGNKPGIYIVNMCRGHDKLGNIVNDSYTRPRTGMFQKEKPMTWRLTMNRERVHKYTKKGRRYSAKTPMSSREKYTQRRNFITSASGRVQTANPNNNMSSNTEEAISNIARNRLAQGNRNAIELNRELRTKYKTILGNIPIQSRRKFLKYMSEAGIRTLPRKIKFLGKLLLRK